MDEVAATVGRHTAARRPLVNKSNRPHLPIFADKLLCGESTLGMDDVLLSGSDDEYYDSPGARCRRLEEQARLFLEGRRPRLLSASLRGPFGRETRWENPWRGRRGKIGTKVVSRSTKTQQPLIVSTSDPGVGSQKQTTAPVATSASNTDLGTTPSTITTQKDPEIKKRAAASNWLRRTNLKRLKPNYDDVLAASPSASRTTRAASSAKAAAAPKTPDLARPTSDLARPTSDPPRDALTTAADEAVGGSCNAAPSQSLASTELPVSHISDSEPSMSVLPSDLFLSSHIGSEPLLPQIPASSKKTTATETTSLVGDEASAAFGDDTTLRPAEQESTKSVNGPMPSEPQPPATSGTEIDASEPSDDVHDGEPAEPSNEIPDEQNTSNFADMTSTTCATDSVAGETTTLSTVTYDTEMVDARIATQDQSPWAKAQSNTMVGDMVAHSSADPVVQRQYDSQATSFVTAQSPWSRETQTLVPVVAAVRPDPPSPDVEADEPEASANETGRPSISVSQNPWADVNTAASSFSSSTSNLPTSPCSPKGETPVLPPIDKEGLEQDTETFLPSLPIPVAHSSGTAPSTPDTKQSSLPTPDMTVSIKSFRRFRSPTPTPPPRRRSAKVGGPRSILRQPRRRSEATASTSKCGRCVHFSLPGYEAAAPADETPGGTAASASIEQRDGTFREPQRAASPPPQDKMLVESLPTEVDRFKGHYATMAGRTRGQRAAILAGSQAGEAQFATADTGVAKFQPIAISYGQDPAPDLELYTSPSVDAMASRFQEVDAETSKLQQIPSGQSRHQSVVSHSGDKVPSADSDNNKENATRGGETEQHGDDDDSRDDDAASAVDAVQDVMDNLDDFLGLWDMDAELAEARAGRM
ncbi:hypothetical protein HMPREF1624_07902 [Sporothrix schenckii ATCC 58251]|uniref:Protamine P1 n=1 Tax=Sporothrix schenckii (strain ATCC 58251 / de Perez 2211183) TaxID=1391915 RepID=U7PMT2_SPOS1|nr:hypothetical protein HMPREF1624_07902 [Sporothrix schenckii ATCC 58251]